MVLQLRHSGEIIGGRTCPTRERDDPVTPATALCAGRGGDGRSLPIVPATGIPLPAGCSASQLPFSGSREQKRFYSETATTFNRTGSPASAPAADFDQRLGRTSPATGIRATPTPWLSAGVSSKCAAKSTFYLIVMCPRRCLRFTTGWCQRHQMKPDNSPPT